MLVEVGEVSPGGVTDQMRQSDVIVVVVRPGQTDTTGARGGAD